MLSKKLQQTETYEDLCRKQASLLVKRIVIGRRWLGSHKPSVGYYGEYLLIQAIKAILPSYCSICQGFIGLQENGKVNMSRQCDIIIYKKRNGVLKSFGSLKVINKKSVYSVIEVKSSIQKKTFSSTLTAFKTLNEFGVRNKFLFVYGNLTKNTLVHFMWESGEQNNDFIVSDTLKYDWPDMHKLPNAILSLHSKKYFALEIFPTSYGDSVCYNSYLIKDTKEKEISCLQEFFISILRGIDPELVLPMDMNSYSIDDGVRLF